MRVVSVWNPKGGQGKSLLAVHLGAAAVEINLKPLVVCEDATGTTTILGSLGKLPFKVASEVPDKEPDADLVIIDHGANEWELPPTRLIVMPVVPKKTQFYTYAVARKQASDAGHKVITVVTNVTSNRPEEQKALTELQQSGAFVLRASGVFTHADNNDTTIFDDSIPEIKRGYKVEERRGEIRAILSAILNEEA
jgi:chromosome partitioning protein